MLPSPEGPFTPYFAYGSNLWHQQMQERCPQHRNLGRAVLLGYRWTITGGGTATVIPSAADEVWGILYGLSASDEVTLDIKECVPRLYVKEMLSVLPEGSSKPIPALVYIDTRPGEGPILAEYVIRMRKGLADSPLPADYVEKMIRPWVPVA